MHYISRDAAAERARELRRQADAARLAREARQSGPREGASCGERLSDAGRDSDRLGSDQLGRGWRRLGRRVAAALADAARAQQRTAALNASLDRHLPQPHQPPATYQEFLTRTAGPLLREPPAAGRSRGRPVG